MTCGLALMIGLGSMAHAEEGAKKGKGKGGEMFAKLDTNSDGKLSLDEFTTGKSGDALEKSKKRFAKIDADGDGSVTKEEMKAAAQARKEAGGKKKKEKN